MYRVVVDGETIAQGESAAIDKSSLRIGDTLLIGASNRCRLVEVNDVGDVVEIFAVSPAHYSAADYADMSNEKLLKWAALCGVDGESRDDIVAELLAQRSYIEKRTRNTEVTWL